ncbi:hypothetical protein RIF29_29371 [Crotalaria pallida]|uniref:Uncharacterized protein n=1 Tax=Crotalaria pallida TaxID=3830 RepID=A0AAN9EEN1_CROPI
MQNLMAMQQQGTAQLQQTNSSSLTAMSSKGFRGPQAASVLERGEHSNSKGSAASPTPINAYRMIFPNSPTSHQGRLFHGNSSGVISTTLQQIQAQSLLTIDVNGEAYLGSLPMGLPMDPIVFQETVLQLSPGLSGAAQWQWALEQAWTQNNHENFANIADMDPHRLSGLGQGCLSAKDGRFARIQEQLGSTENYRNRKLNSSYGDDNIAIVGNRVGPSRNSLTSHHTPDNGIYTTSSKQHVNNVQKGLMMDGTKGIRGIASSSNFSACSSMNMEGVRDKAESTLPIKGGDDETVYGTTKQSSNENEKEKETSKVFTFAEYGCIRTSDNKVTCCNFSSDGKFLASAGHEKKVVLWNKDTLKMESTPKDHSSVISDVCFRPNSYGFATSSIDKSIRLWDAANPKYCVKEYSGHSSPIMSLDFHPSKTDLFCFSDSDDEIRFWNITTSSCTCVIKGGNPKVRFRPGAGRVLAAAYDKGVSIFDVESGVCLCSLQGGHPEAVNYICWDANGNHLASSLELWNMAMNRHMTVTTHDNIISSLVRSPVTEMLASASHDGTVKLWK